MEIESEAHSVNDHIRIFNMVVQETSVSEHPYDKVHVVNDCFQFLSLVCTADKNGDFETRALKSTK